MQVIQPVKLCHIWN